MSGMHSENIAPLFRAAAHQWPALTLLIAIALMGATEPRLYAADPGSVRWQARSSPLNDCQLAAEARRIMMTDPILAEFNIGVTVVDGTLTAWGAVPDLEAAARVRARLSTVAGISTVVDDLRIDADRRWRPLMTAVAAEPNPSAERYKTGLASGCPKCEPATVTSAVPAIALNNAGGGPAQMPSVTLLKPTLTDTDLSDQLETLRRSVPGFRNMGVRSVGSVVCVRPHNAQAATVREFARRISQLPGVSRVLIEENRRPGSLAIP